MFKIALIGLDTSHSVKFTELIQGPDRIVYDLQVVSCMRFPTPFQSKQGQDERQKKLEALGVKVLTDFDEAVSDVDGIMIEINDPSLHLEYFEKSAMLGLPIFLDKPMADDVEGARRIVEISHEKNIKAWTASSLRFSPELEGAIREVNAPSLGYAFGPLGEAPAGECLIWYGIHTFEILNAIMGSGAKTVFATEDSTGIVAIVNYTNGRRGIVECNMRGYDYGGKSQALEIVKVFEVKAENGQKRYAKLISKIRDFMLDGRIPITLEESFEIQAMLEASIKSIHSGKTISIAKMN